MKETERWGCRACDFSMEVEPNKLIACRSNDGGPCGLHRMEPDLRQADVRGSTHGDFALNALFAMAIRNVMRSRPGWDQLDESQRLALDEIALKIARILSGGADVAEHWIDIQGYAKLGEKVCKR